MIVYMLINKITNDFYIGSTNNIFNRVYYYHEEYINGRRKIIRETGGFRGWTFVVIDKVDTENRELNLNGYIVYNLI